jgi:hypothetical protein
MSESVKPVPDLGQDINVSNWVLDGISGVFLCLRIYCKLLQRRRLWWDDHFLVASWVSLLPLFHSQLAGRIETGPNPVGRPKPVRALSLPSRT